MIKIGVRAHDYGKDTPHQLFHKISADGFSTVQLALKKSISGVNQFGDITQELIHEINQERIRSDLSVAVLGVYVEPSLADEKLRTASISELIGSIPFAKELEAGCIGTETTSRSKQPGVTRKEALYALLNSLWSIMPVAEENGVTIAIEPVYYHTVNTPECAADVLKTIRSPNLKIIFDPVNLLSGEEISFQHQLWNRCFNSFGQNIAAVHMKGVRQDSQGKLVSAGFAHSIVDYPYLFRFLKKMPQDFSILREEIKPESAKEDLSFLENLLLGE